jgi:hypothetical protein
MIFMSATVSESPSESTTQRYPKHPRGAWKDEALHAAPPGASTGNDPCDDSFNILRRVVATILRYVPLFRSLNSDEKSPGEGRLGWGLKAPAHLRAHAHAREETNKKWYKNRCKLIDDDSL